MHHQKVDNPPLQVVNHADLHCMEVVRIREVTHETENMSKHIEFLLSMA